MKQAIAGVSPADQNETTVMTVWPSNAYYGIGRMLGGLYSISAGFYVFRIGNLLALLTAPVAAVVFFLRLLPWIGIRYRVTNRRLIVERGWAAIEDKSLALDRFDDIDVEVAAGQEWYDAGNLIFREGKVERFRLEGVSRPKAFKQICMKSRNAFVGVQEALKHQVA